MLAKVIKKEVFDLSDTMDVLAQVVNRQDQRLIRMENNIQALVSKG